MAGQEGGGGKCGVSGRTGRGVGGRSLFSFSYSFLGLRFETGQARGENENEYENENEGEDDPSRASTLLRGAGIRGFG